MAQLQATGWKGKENVPVQEVVTGNCSDPALKRQFFSSCLSPRVPSPLTKEAASLKLLASGGFLTRTSWNAQERGHQKELLRAASKDQAVLGVYSANSPMGQFPFARV